jgi:hydroxymethylglutaryl-CoA lyase
VGDGQACGCVGGADGVEIPAGTFLGGSGQGRAIGPAEAECPVGPHRQAEAVLAVEGLDQHQEAVFAGVQVTGQFGDLLAQAGFTSSACRSWIPRIPPVAGRPCRVARWTFRMMQVKIESDNPQAGPAAPFVVVNDVGPRDGLQNQAKILPPAQRVRLVQALLDAGMKHVEVGAFVSPKAVPAMVGADQVLAGLRGTRDATFTVLIPNVRGYELARAAGAASVCMVVYGSDGMARANARISRRQADDAAAQILQLARADGVRVTATLAVAFECPFDGPVESALVEDAAARFLALGADEFCIADTIGAANPAQVRALTRSLVKTHGADRLGCHFHDTRAMGLANVYAAVESGIRKFDAAIAGLGGCPFAPGASGNVATEDVVMLLGQMGFATGIDLARLMQAAQLAQELTGTAPGGRASAWLRRRLDRAR